MAPKEKIESLLKLSETYLEKKYKFAENYLAASNAATGSLVDPNANIEQKTNATLGSEIVKDVYIQINRYSMKKRLKELFSEEIAEQYINQLEDHLIYFHDETKSAIGSPYCAAITLYPLVSDGLKSLNAESRPPKHLDSFCGAFVNLVFAVSSSFAGAVATPEMLLYFHHFARKDYGEDYLEKVPDIIKNNFQQIVYSLNSPAGNRGLQKVFWNISFFDRHFYDAFFKDFYFPGINGYGSQNYDFDSYNKLQKFFMDWLRKEREKALLTFPILTEASIDKDGKPLDEEWADWCAEKRSEGLSFFSYNSESVDSLSSCCLHYDSIIRVWRNKEFENIKIGDFVESFIIEEPQNIEIEKKIAPFYEINGIDFQNLRLRKTAIVGILKKKNSSGVLYEIQVNQNLIRATPDHVFKAKTKDPRNKDLEFLDLRADQLVRGKHLLFEMSNDRAPDDCWQEIKKITKVPSSQWVYDIELQDHHFFFANGIGLSNCRLRNAIDENAFSFSLGFSGVKTGSVGVITLNLNRFAQKYSSSKEDMFKKLPEVIDNIHVYHVALRSHVEELKKSGLLPVYDAGYIDLDKQFSTLGISGINEMAEFYGLEVSNNPEYIEFCQNVLKIFKDQNILGRKKYNIKFNTEFVPGEGLGVKNQKWDKREGLKVNENRIAYNSYLYLPESDTTSIPDKFKLHGSLAEYLDGGSALHCNCSDLPDKKFFLWLRNLAAKYHTNYWTTNVKQTFCDDCGHIDYRTLEKCPKCGSTNLDYSTRCIGYAKRISSFSEDRQKEEAMRFYH